MNAKVKNSEVIALALVIVVVIGLIIPMFVMWWQSQLPIGATMGIEQLEMQGYTWGTNNANITLSVRNTGTVELPVSEVRVNDVVVNNVAYGGNFTGTTTHTLGSGAYGTIAITYPFSSGVNYEFDVVSARDNKWTYPVTAP